MMLMVFLLLMSVSGGDINKIARINNMKKLAEAAYKNGNYDDAISSFRTLTDSLGINEDPVLLNLANAYFQKQDTLNATNYYSRVLNSENPELKSLAYQQMGVINQQKNKLPEALSDFKAALKSNAQNEDARYNYELLKKILNDQEEQQKKENDDIEPSEYAKKLKAQADKLVKQNQFGQALGIMQKGLEVDKTVAAYNAFITKVNDVVESKE